MKNSNKELISVIICHYIGDFIYDCVKSIKQSKKVDYEIIIVSDNPSLEVAGCQIIHSEEGPAFKRNLGAYYAKGEYLAFFDDDTHIMPYCLYEMKDILSAYDYIGMVYSKILTMGTNRFDDAGSYVGSWGFLIERSNNVEDKGQFDEMDFILAGKSASCMIKKNIFMAIGGFDSSFFMFGEETDLSWRVWLRGDCVTFVPLAITYHAFNTPLKTISHYKEKVIYFDGCKNYITMLIKNLEWHNLIRILPKHLLIWLFVAFIFVLKGEFRKVKYTFGGIFYNLWHLGAICRKKARINATIRQKKDKDILPYIYKATPFSYYINRFITYVKMGRSGC